MPERTVVVAGGGASGTLLASALVRRSDRVRAIVVEPREQLGAGVAYSTQCPAHLLNVPAGKMSAFAEEPDHFVRWLGEDRPGTFSTASFVPRTIYGEYLNAIASQAQRAAGPRWKHVRAIVSDATSGDAGVCVTLSSGETLHGDALVVASGNAAPAPWPGAPTEGAGAERFFASAWETGALHPPALTGTVLLLGTGLTAIDAVLGLRHNGHRGSIIMVSRRGLLPHEHRLLDAPAEESPDAPPGWRARVDALRPQVNALWRGMELGEQRRFLRHLMPYWNVHRHRMAPEVAKGIAGLIASGDLRMLAGRTGEIVATRTSLRVTIALRATGERLVVDADRVINCSGPEHDFHKLPNPLIRRLMERGALTPHPLNIGIDVAENGALVDAGGVPSARIFAIGPVRYGTLIETTAIPEIRAQVRELAAQLTDAAPVEMVIASNGV